jgi:DNA invertase Pin-like site-specific DNA recombinase
MAKIGYARVSTREQHPEHQVDALNAAGCERIYVDKASGKLARRPELDKALEYLRGGDQLVITRLDRLGRSLQHLLTLVAQLGADGVDLVVLQQGLDTSTPGGRLLFHFLAAIAEFQRELIVEGTLDGLEAARARGRVGGRPPALTELQIDLARRMYDETDRHGRRRHTVSAIAETFGVSRATVYRHLELAGNLEGLGFDEAAVDQRELSNSALPPHRTLRTTHTLNSDEAVEHTAPIRHALT